MLRCCNLLFRFDRTTHRRCRRSHRSSRAASRYCRKRTGPAQLAPVAAEITPADAHCSLIAVVSPVALSVMMAPTRSHRPDWPRAREHDQAAARRSPILGVFGATESSHLCSSALLAQPLSQASLRCVSCRSSFTCDLYATAAAHRLEAIGQHAGGFGRPFFVVVSRYWNGVSGAPRDLPQCRKSELRYYFVV
jgi:hypothetical protein